MVQMRHAATTALRRRVAEKGTSAPAGTLSTMTSEPLPAAIAPSGRYGFDTVETGPRGPVVQVVQLLKDGSWFPTAGRYYAETVADVDDRHPEGMVLDGRGPDRWVMPPEDTVALAEFARAVLDEASGR